MTVLDLLGVQENLERKKQRQRVEPFHKFIPMQMGQIL